MIKKNYKKLINKAKFSYNKDVLIAIKWSFIGQILTRLTNLISAIILARLMLPEKFGAYTYLIGTLVFFSQLISLSIRTTSTRNIAFLLNADKESCEKYIKVSLLAGFYLSILGIISISILVLNFSDSNILNYYSTNLLLFTSLAIFSELFYGLILGVLGGLKLFKIINLITISSNFGKFIFSIVFYIFFDIEGAIIGWVGTSIIVALFGTLLLHLELIKEKFSIWNHKLTETKKEFLLFIKISIPISIEASFILISTWYIQTLILNDITQGKTQLAIYNVAYQWKSLAIYVPAILINLLQPFLSNYHGDGDKNEFNKLINITQKVVFISSVLISLLLIISSGIIIKMFGNGFEEAKKILIILIIPSIFIGLSSLYRETFISKGFVWLIALGNLVMALVNVILFNLLKEYYSMSISFAVAVSCGEIFIFIFYFFIKYKYMKNE